MPVRTPFQGDFLLCVVPRAEALGCSLFALRAIGTRTRKRPNSKGHCLQRPKRAPVRSAAGAARLSAPKSLPYRWLVSSEIAGDRLAAGQARKPRLYRLGQQVVDRFHEQW